jgi:hypothetical protein
MPRQIDQLPPDATSLARRLAALEREVREMRAARRMTAASVGTLRVYADDGTTLLAELGPDAGNGGGGLWTRGMQDPINMSGYLSSGQLQFRPVENNLVADPASIYYDSDAFQYSDLVLTSGAVNPSDHQALLILESLFDGTAHASIQGENSSPCTFDVLGVFTSGNLAWGSVSLTPTTVNVPISTTVNGLNVMGSTFIGFASAVTSLPGSPTSNNGVTGVSTNNVSSTGLTVWMTRQSITTTTVNWLVIGI